MLTENYFSLFGLPVRFRMDRTQLEQARHAAVSCVHPDRYAGASPAEQRVAVQWSAHINQAYQQLVDPLLRACYLCTLANIDLQLENNTAMRPEFLMQQIQWREKLEALSARQEDATALHALKSELQAAEFSLENLIAELLDQQGNYPLAVAPIREWMFMRKLHQDVAQRLRHSPLRND